MTTEAWRTDWEELQKAIDGNTIDEALISRLQKTHTGQVVTQEFTLSEEHMLPQPEHMLPQLEPEPQSDNMLATPEGIPPDLTLFKNTPSVLDSSKHQSIISAISKEPRPSSVAPASTFDSAEQDLLRRIGLAAPAAASGVEAQQSAGRELGVSGDVITVAFKKIYDPFARPGIPRPTSAVTEQLSLLLEKSGADPTSPAPHLQATSATGGRVRSSVVAGWAPSSSIVESPMDAKILDQNAGRPATAVSATPSQPAGIDSNSAPPPSRARQSTEGDAMEGTSMQQLR